MCPMMPALSTEYPFAEEGLAANLVPFPAIRLLSEFRWVSHGFYGGQCDRHGGARYGRRICGVWILDGRVAGVCSECEFN